MSRITTAALAAASALALLGCDEKKAAPPTDSPAVAVAAPAAEAPPAKAEIDVPEFAISTAPADIEKGRDVFAAKGCVACHKVGGGRLVGPDLKGVTAKRDEAWLKKMILRPDVMVKEDPVAKKMLGEYLTPMPNQGVDPKNELPFILAYLKSTE
jgi:mono/diheme cytochrome c family protein